MIIYTYLQQCGSWSLTIYVSRWGVPLMDRRAKQGFYNSQALRDILDITDFQSVARYGMDSKTGRLYQRHGMAWWDNHKVKRNGFVRPKDPRLSQSPSVAFKDSMLALLLVTCLEILALHAASWGCMDMGIMYFHELHMIHHDTFLHISADTRRFS